MKSDSGGFRALAAFRRTGRNSVYAKPAVDSTWRSILNHYFVCERAPKTAVVNSPGLTFSELDITTTPLRCIGYITILCRKVVSAFRSFEFLNRAAKFGLGVIFSIPLNKSGLHRTQCLGTSQNGGGEQSW